MTCRELQRPGQSLVELADRVKLSVRAIANASGVQQEPEFVYDKANASRVEEFMFVGSIGAERISTSVVDGRISDAAMDKPPRKPASCWPRHIHDAVMIR